MKYLVFIRVGKSNRYCARASQILVRIKPIVTEILNLQGLGAVVGAISRNLADLQDRQGSYLSIYDQPALPLQVFLIYII